MTRIVQTPRQTRFGDLFDMLTDRGRALLRWRDPAGRVTAPPGLPDMGELLLSRRGEASGVALARALVAAGSVVTEDVPDDAMAIARGRQANKPGRGVKPKRKEGGA